MDKATAIIYFMSITSGKVALTPEPRIMLETLTQVQPDSVHTVKYQKHV